MGWLYCLSASSWELGWSQKLLLATVTPKCSLWMGLGEVGVWGKALGKRVLVVGFFDTFYSNQENFANLKSLKYLNFGAWQQFRHYVFAHRMYSDFTFILLKYLIYSSGNWDPEIEWQCQDQKLGSWLLICLFTIYESKKNDVDFIKFEMSTLWMTMFKEWNKKP